MPFTSANAAEYARARHDNDHWVKTEMHARMKMMRDAKAGHRKLRKGTYDSTVAVYSTHASRHTSVQPPIQNIEIETNAPTVSSINFNEHGSPQSNRRSNINKMSKRTKTIFHRAQTLLQKKTNSQKTTHNKTTKKN